MRFLFTFVVDLGLVHIVKVFLAFFWFCWANIILFILILDWYYYYCVRLQFRICSCLYWLRKEILYLFLVQLFGCEALNGIVAATAGFTACFGLFIRICLFDDGDLSLYDICFHFVVYFNVDVVHRWRTRFRIIWIFAFLPNAKIRRLFHFLSTPRRVISPLRHLTRPGLLAKLTIFVFNKMTLGSLRQNWRYFSVHVVWNLVRHRLPHLFHAWLRLGNHRIFGKHFVWIASVLIPEQRITSLTLSINLLLLLTCGFLGALLLHHIDLNIIQSNYLILLCRRLFFAQMDVISLSGCKLAAEVFIVRISM